MGAVLTRVRPDFVIYVTTGHNNNAGTDANVTVKLHDESGKTSPDIKLDNFFVDDFERGCTDTFYLSADQHENIHHVSKLELWRDRSGLGDDWFVEKIAVESRKSNEVFVFPIWRWVKPHEHYIIHCYDTSIPQLDEHQERRKDELEDKRKIYEYFQKIPNGPVQVKELPADEDFPPDVKWNFFASKVQLKFKIRQIDSNSKKWTKIDDIKKVFDGKTFSIPECAARWKEDEHFAAMRLNALVSTVIRLCEKIPDKLAVTEEMLEPLLEGNSLQSLLDNKKIFICDLEILQDTPTIKNCVLNSPIALFMVNKENKLMPLAIQLEQKPSEDNPVFLPTDDYYLWLYVKMWYNNSEAAYHQSLTHLGFTHLLVEGFSIATHRQLSVSHPIFKFLAPHFLYLLAINAKALVKLLNPGGYFDTNHNQGRDGTHEIIRKGFEVWDLSVDGTLPEDLKRRGLDDTSVLPGFYFREDALLLYDSFLKYTTAYVELYYDSDDKISGDWELQNWGHELHLDRNNNGVGIKGMPNEGVFKTKEDVIKVANSIIFTSSAMHAACNFGQYEYYAFPPNYPSLLKGDPPKTKNPVTESHILDSLPDKDTTFKGLVLFTILSEKSTRSLADFEIQYAYDPKAVAIVKQWRSDLRKVEETIKERNKSRTLPYDYLIPEYIPNAVSI